MAGPQVPKDFRRVIVAAAVGNVIEWYDFYIFGSLAAILSVKFFEKSHPVAALLSTIARFTAARRDHRDAPVFWDTRFRSLGLAGTIPRFLPAGGDCDLHQAPTAGDANFRGDQGQGADD